MARDRRKAMLRVGVLLDECQLCPKHVRSSTPVEEVERICGGCAVYTELRQLGAGLQKDPPDRFRAILAKGTDMTRSDITLLLENEVRKRDIRKALQMSVNAFDEMMFNFGFPKQKYKKGVEKVAVVEGFKLSIEEYGEFKKQGLKDNKIAEKLGINKQQLANWKYLRKDQLIAAGLANTSKQASVSVIKAVEAKEAPKEATELIVQTSPTAQQIPVTEKQNEYAELINELSDALDEAKKKEKHSDDLILELEEKLKGYQDLQEEYQLLVKRTGQHEGSYKDEIAKLHAACDDVEEELEKARGERDKQIEKNYQNSYVIENQKNIIEKKSAQVSKLEEENAALRKLVQLWI